MEASNKKYKIGLRISLLLILAFLFFGYFYLFNPTQEGSYFLRCPSNSIFGINCPGCGSQRAIHHLMHLEFAEAFRNNALLIVSLPIIIYVMSIWLFNFIFDQQVKLKLFKNKRIIWIGLIIILLFGILRNIPIYPFSLLAPN